MQRPSGYSANPNLVLRCLALLLAGLLLTAASALADGSALPACYNRPTFRDPPWVDTERFCAELVYQSAHNEALALAALAVAPDGTLYAASPLRGEVWALRDSDGDQLPDDAQLVVSGLTLPSGLDWGGDALYITGGPNIWRLPAGAQGAKTLVTDLPLLPGQWGGDLVVGADGELYVSLIAPCAACDPGDAPSILAMAPDGSQRRVLARGLRQPTGLALRDGELWATDSAPRARPQQGDALDELNRVTPGAHFGWPWCLGAQRRPALPGALACEQTQAPALSLPTGSQPLGLAHYDHDALPGLQGALLLTLHGSRHRVDLRGYALAAITFDAQGQPLPPQVILPQQTSAAFDSFFTVRVMNYRGSGFWPGRPLDVAVSPEGWLYVSMTGGRILALRPA